MIQILLADDDILSLNRITGLIDWNSNGYEIVGQALGGTQCLALLEELKPDILILDIDMPDKNGVEVTKEIQQRQIPVKVLIISNYDTFSFVRSALHYGAYDYLLKHQIDAPALLSKLEEISRLIKKEDDSSSHMSYFTTVAKQNYLNSLICFKTVSRKEHTHMMSQRDFSSAFYCLAALQINNFILITHFSPQLERQKMIDSILTVSGNILSTLHNGLITHVEYGQFAILFSYDNESSTQKLLEQAGMSVKLIAANVQKLFGVTVIYEISGLFTDLTSLGRVFEQTRSALEQRPFSEVQSFGTKNQLDIQEEKSLMNSLTALDVSQVETQLKILYEKYKGPSGELPQTLLWQLLQIGGRFLQNQQVDLAWHTNPDYARAKLAGLKPGDLETFLINHFKKILEQVPGYGSRKYSTHIQKALLYIHANYAQDISLGSAANFLHLSATHLSRLFSREVGTSFIDYLIHYRVERAKQLIQNTDTDLKSIAEQTGFRNYNYFLRTYKEKTGHTPSQEMQSRKSSE